MEYTPDRTILEAAQECMIVSESCMEIYSSLENLPTNDQRFSKLVEAALDGEKKNIVKRFVDTFTSFVKRIIAWLSEKIKLITDKFASLSTSSGYEKKKIKAPANIKRLGEIQEQFLNTLNELMHVDIAKMVQDLDKKKNSHDIKGYVKSMSKYDDMSIEEIQEDMFGQIVEQSGLSPTMMQKAIKSAGNIQHNLTGLTVMYSNNLYNAATMDLSHPRIVADVHKFFIRNTNLIASLTGYTITIATHAMRDLTR